MVVNIPSRFKCKVMHLGKPLEEQFKYTLHDGTIRHDLGYTSEEKDIGVSVLPRIEKGLEEKGHFCSRNYILRALSRA